MTRRAGLALVVAAAIIPYLASLDGAFVFDDGLLIVDNEHVHSLSSPGRFFSDADTLSHEGALHSYRPLRTLMFAIEWAVFGPRAWAFRIVSVLLHAGVAVLLLLWLRRLGVPEMGALLATLLFAVHPVAVEAVAWISIQGDLVMAGAVIGALLVLEGGESRRRIAAALALFVVALGGKEAAVILPALLVVRRFWPIGLARGPSARTILIFGACAVAYLALRSALVTDAAHRPWYGGSRWATYGAVLAALNYYAGTLLFPVGLTVRWAPGAPPGGPLEWGLLFTGSILLVALVRYALVARARRPIAAGGIALLLLALAPAANLAFPLPTVSELRYLYLPLAFLALAIAPLLAAAPRPAVITLLAILALLTTRRATEWTTPEALWTAAYERPRRTPEALMALASIRASTARQAVERGETDVEALLESARYWEAFLAESNPKIMHPRQRETAQAWIRFVDHHLRAAGKTTEAERLARALRDW